MTDYPLVLDPDKLTHRQCRVIAAWLEENGCDEYVALLPITVDIIDCPVVNYQAICPKAKLKAPPEDGGPRYASDGSVITYERWIRARTPMPDWEAAR